MDSSNRSPEFSSPFETLHEQLVGLKDLRKYLSNTRSFCRLHSQIDQQAQETALLHRDFLHALLLPITRLYQRASELARFALCATKPEDLELAFSGEARGAFLWLQCFLEEEPDWCQAKGCPACVTMETTSTESHIRLIIAASLLASAPIPPAISINTWKDRTTGIDIPPFPDVIPALREALAKDPFWSNYWSHLYARGMKLSDGIAALVSSCVDLEFLVLSTTPPKPSPRRSITLPGLMCTATGEEHAGVKLQTSKLAERQLRLKDEEAEMMRECAMRCWTQPGVPRMEGNEFMRRSARRKCLTCP